MAIMSASLSVRGIQDLIALTTFELIGILIAISGNILISFALNLQKLAHKRVEKEKRHSSVGIHYRPAASLDERDEIQENAVEHADGDVFSDFPARGELSPLNAYPGPMTGDYGSEPALTHVRRFSKTSRFLASHLSPTHNLGKLKDPSDPSRNKGQRSLDAVQDNEGDYLRSKLWWFGFLLMNVGELGNFISYAFAPASVVAPLGTFALMANCFFAPLLLGEYFYKRDLIGVFIAIIGAVTVVLASDASDVRLNPEGLLKAISQTSFLVYCSIYSAGAVLLATLSEGDVGKTWVFIDVGLCALFGGFTVLSTKALSTLLTLQWIEMFSNWITYPLIAVLILTGIGQIRYLNRALMRFDSKVVIPIQFVLFSLSAITGSAVLYGDFQKATFHEILTFLYGCAATFVGVFIIAWTPKDSVEEDSVEEEPFQTQIADVSLGTSDDGLCGSISRRKRGTIALPNGINSPKDTTPSLGRKRSAIGLLGISQAQHLLLVHTPPHEIPQRERDVDSDVEPGLARTPDSVRRHRRRSWYGFDSQRDRSENANRDNNLVGRLTNGAGRVGSLEDR